MGNKELPRKELAQDRGRPESLGEGSRGLEKGLKPPAVSLLGNSLWTEASLQGTQHSSG